MNAELLNRPPEVTDPQPDNFHVEDGKVTLVWMLRSTGELLHTSVVCKEGSSAYDVRASNLAAWRLGVPSIGIPPATLVPLPVYTPPDAARRMSMSFGERIGTLAGHPVVDAIHLNGVRYEPDGVAAAASSAEVQNGTVMVEGGMVYRAAPADANRSHELQRALADGIHRRISAGLRKP